MASLNVTVNVLLSPDSEVDAILGSVFSFNVTVLFDCVVSALLPPPSNMASATGVTFKTSFPSAMPLYETVNRYILPSRTILLGVLLARVAAPPVSVNSKSVFSKNPLPFASLKVGSLKSTISTALS